MSDTSKRKAKQKWAIEKPKLDNARQLRGIFFIETLVESWKFRCQQQCFVKHHYIAAGKPAAVLGNTRPNVLVLSMPTNL